MRREPCLPGVTVVVRNQETGMVRETVSGPGRHASSPAASCRAPIRSTAELQGFKKFERKDLRLEVGKTSSIDVSMAVGTIEETVTVTAGVAARRRHLEGDRRQHHQRNAGEAAERQRQFRRLRRPPARHRSVDQHGVVRQRFDQRQRPGSAQQQLHARRRQQQRRRHRAACGDARHERQSRRSRNSR